MNKRANWLTENFGKIVLVMLVIIALIFGVIRPLWNSGETIAQKQQCSDIVGSGECKEKCETGSEQAFENGFGCPPKNSPEQKFCCISLEKSDDARNYGGNSDYNFNVEYIGFKEQDSCEQDKVKQNQWYCPPGLNVHFYVKVSNIGKNTIPISGNPKVVKDNVPVAKYPFGAASNVDAKASVEVDAGNITLSANNSITYKAYAAAKCISAKCKEAAKGAAQTDGIYRIRDDSWVVIITKES